jgi:uncharacterized protein (TIGR03435 family)
VGIAAAMVLGMASAQLMAQDESAVKKMAADAVPQFEVAIIKRTDPNWRGSGFHDEGRRIFCDNKTLDEIVAFAYGVHATQIVGAPGWAGTDKYDVNGVSDVEGNPDLKQMQGMYRKLLAERFKLTFHREKKELSAYAIRAAKGGAKLTKSAGDPNGLGSDASGDPSGMKFTDTSMEEFVLVMQLFALDKPVVDQTGLMGRYDFLLKWSPDEAQSSDLNAPPGLFTAIQEQLGLKLEGVKAPVDVIVIDHVERPSAN